MHALIHYNEVRLPAESLLGGEGQAFAIAQTRLGRRTDPPRHADGGDLPEGPRHDVRAGAVARDPGKPAGRQAERPELRRRLLRPADAVPVVRPLRGLGDRRIPGLPQGPPRHRRHQGAHPAGPARHRPALHPGPRGTRGVERDAAGADVDDGAGHGAGGRPERGPPGDRGPAGAEALPGGPGTVADGAPARRRSPPPGRSSPNTSSSKWRTCSGRGDHAAAGRGADQGADRRGGPGPVDGRPGPPRCRRAPRNHLHHRGRLQRAVRDPPGRAPDGPAPAAADRARRAQRDDAARVPAAGRPGRHRRPPRPGRGRVRRPRTDGGLLLPDGVRRRVVTDGRRRVARSLRHRRRGPARAWPSNWSTGSPSCPGSTGRRRDWPASGGPTASTNARSTGG